MLERRITTKILAALKINPVVFLNGARQAGKSTLVQRIRDKVGTPENPAAYVSFDRPTQMAAASSAPEAFLSAYENNLIIDEVQMVPEIFRTLKISVDELRLKDKVKVNGKYLLTGSANILALPKLSDALVGRMSVLTLYPFCTAEACGGKGNGIEHILNMEFSSITNHGLDLQEAIKMATFPEIIEMEGGDRMLWMNGYLTTILQRDVRMLADLEKIALLPTLLRVLATRAGNLINDSDISRGIGLNAVTGKFYRNILKMMFLNFDINPWFRNIGKRLVKSPKGYITDTFMLCYMLGLDIDTLKNNKPDLFGHILENYVATELIKQLSFSNTTARLLHFRTSDGKEVDFVLEKPDGSVFARDVKMSEFVNAHDFKGINTLAALAKNDFLGGAVLYTGQEVVPFGKNLWALPFHVLWQ